MKSRTALNRVGSAVDDLAALFSEKVEAALVLARFFEDARVEEEDLSKLDVAVRHVSEHVLVVDEGLAGGGVAAGEVLGDGEGEPVAAHARLGFEDLESDCEVVVVVAQVDGEGREVVQEVERVLERVFNVRRGLRSRADTVPPAPFRFRRPFCST